MDKFIHLFDTIDNFESNKEKLDLLSSYIAFSEDDSKIHIKEYKIESPIIDVENTKSADIAIYDNVKQEIIIGEGELYSKELFPLVRYTPIGVVVVPASHAPNGRARIISLAAMDCSNPDNGDSEGHYNMFWGNANEELSNLLPFHSNIPYINEANTINFGDEQTIKGYALGGGYVSSDYYNDNNPNRMQNPFMTDEYYYFNNVSYYYFPSPYLENNMPNPIYRDTSNSNVLSDFNGKGNTDIIINLANKYSTDWQTASTIQNSNRNKYNYPPAQCCWRYHTVGTNQGDWYLPSAGELAYLCARRKAIDTSIQKIIDNGTPALLLVNFSYYWGSTKKRIYDSIDVNLADGGLGFNDIDYKLLVRAFLEV